MSIASAAYPLEWHESWASVEEKLTRWVGEAAGKGADLLVFPEYGAMELASLAGAAAAADPKRALAAAAERRAQADALLAALAAKHRVHILGGSGPVFDGIERPVNRATFFGPDGVLGHQDKQVMTPYERAPLDVVPGNALTLFITELGRIGILICYDSEFPLFARAFSEAGAEILLVPSCTETRAGFTRVRVGAMARALENQCVTVHSATVGAAEWCPPVDHNIGCAAIYGPPDTGWPDTGILTETALNEPGWAFAKVSRKAIAEVRSQGGVRNFSHWNEQITRCAQVEIRQSDDNPLEKQGQ
ncbi:carbon-nitrogen hydrolase family protein [Alkalilacustris brevis]|uniref:carbon-nitrogen hydrolase family protein n=1 Tax=Alkalilacustris brevis TaxID=2026338 RepID=UPI000E0D11EB|nr:carbon-nitrogen hydrolase family protein [Alkalilacustris brevis]